jgi:hypothetical protein
MAITVFQIDGKQFNNVHVTSLTRKFQILDGPNAARGATGNMIRDIVGTYFNYTLELALDGRYQAEYDTFYELVCDPKVDSHVIEMPYGQSTITFDAYISAGEDKLNFMSTDNKNYWEGITLDFIAMKPQIRRA